MIIDIEKANAANGEGMPVPYIQEKSWLNQHKPDCLFCDENPSTLEAVCGEGNIVSHIRCCESQGCQEKAKDMALDQYKMRKDLET